ncbi:hypothetical protein Salat_2044400 [Sesamum alatum]|uniref:Uncharacterized protein n=1 Tax=Sesamum alatum TaxID=300844 RepID=A0AAE1XZP8_9LAMI|nr:hypothetical protein Salat_2044400 [Sesamum alatum]
MMTLTAVDGNPRLCRGRSNFRWDHILEPGADGQIGDNTTLMDSTDAIVGNAGGLTEALKSHVVLISPLAEGARYTRSEAFDTTLVNIPLCFCATATGRVPTPRQHWPKG